jgi:hypothetical protein
MMYYGWVCLLWCEITSVVLMGTFFKWFHQVAKHRLWDCGSNRRGERKKKSKTKYNETPPREFIAYLKPWLEQLFSHVARCIVERTNGDLAWKVHYFMCWLKSKSCTMRVHNEIQNMHWHKFQVTILVQICCMKLVMGHASKDGFGMLKEVHYYVSNDNAWCLNYLYNMFSCYISTIWNNKVVSQKCIMFGMMGTMANLS